MVRTVAAPSSSVRSSTATGCPSCASRRATAAPMPRAAPVTTATRPASRVVIMPLSPPRVAGGGIDVAYALMISFELGRRGPRRHAVRASHPCTRPCSACGCSPSPGLSALHLPWLQVGSRQARRTRHRSADVPGRGAAHPARLPDPAARDFAPPSRRSSPPSAGRHPGSSAATCGPRTPRIRSPTRCGAPAPRRRARRRTARRRSAHCCGRTGRSPSSRCGRRCACCWRPT